MTLKNMKKIFRPILFIAVNDPIQIDSCERIELRDHLENDRRESIIKIK